MAVDNSIEVPSQPDPNAVISSIVSDPLADALNNFEPTGVFQVDYQDVCRRLNVANPMTVARIRYNQPVLPASTYGSTVGLKQSASQDTNGALLNTGGSKDFLNNADGVTVKNVSMSNNAVNRSAGATPLENLKSAHGSSSGLAHSVHGSVERVASAQPSQEDVNVQETISSSKVSLQQLYEPKYLTRPLIGIETSDEDEEEVLKVAIRGWKLSGPNMDALTWSIPACLSITTLNLWNCGLDDALFNSLITLVQRSNISFLQVDQNKAVSELLYAQLLSDLTPIKHLSLRGNHIGNSGAESIAAALKLNHSLLSLNLWNNDISSPGAEALADALKLNQSLASISLAHNKIDDVGAKAFAKALSKCALTHEEIAIRKKYAAELEKLKRDKEMEEIDALKRGAKGGKPLASGVAGGASIAAATGHRPGSSHNGKNDIPRRFSNTDLKVPGGAMRKAGAAVPGAAKAGVTPAAGANKAPGKGAGGPVGAAATANAAAGSAAPAPGTVPGETADQTAQAKAGNKKAGTTPAATAANAANAAASTGQNATPAAGADEKGVRKSSGENKKKAAAAGAAVGKDGKAAAGKGAAAGKKGAESDMAKGTAAAAPEVDDDDATGNGVAVGSNAMGGVGTDVMFEQNGVWYVWGNRSLCNLNLSRNQIGEEGLRALAEAVMDPEVNQVGLFSLSLHDNPRMDKNHPLLVSLQNSLNSRNPFLIDIDASQHDTATIADTEPVGEEQTVTEE